MEAVPRAAARRLALLALLLVPAPPVAAGEGAADLDAAFGRRDFFALRELVATAGATVPRPDLLFYRAVVEHAFNGPARSNELLASLLASGELAPERAVEVHRLRMSNGLRLHDYGRALEAARAALALPAGDPALREELENTAKLLAALAGAPPQRVAARGPSRIKLADGRVPLEVVGQKRRFALDTGANISVIARSEAEALGLAIRPAGVAVTTSTGSREGADVAVADQVRIGNLEYRHVAFLVFPDAALTFPNGLYIPGLVGFPLVEAMGEVRFRRDGVLEVPLDPPRRTDGNLALDELDPRVRVRYGRDRLICRLDTGAGATVFYQPFFERYRESVLADGEPVEVETGGVGGVLRLAAIRLPRLTLNVASADVELRKVEVYTEPIGAPGHRALDCNLGRDALEPFRAYTLNFRDMALLVR